MVAAACGSGRCWSPGWEKGDVAPAPNSLWLKWTMKLGFWNPGVNISLSKGPFIFTVMLVCIPLVGCVHGICSITEEVSCTFQCIQMFLSVWSVSSMSPSFVSHIPGGLVASAVLAKCWVERGGGDVYVGSSSPWTVTTLNADKVVFC